MQPSDHAKSVIRPFRMADLERVYEIEHQSFPHPWPKFMFRRIHCRNPQGFLIAEREGNVIGYGIAEIERRRRLLGSRSKRRGHLLNLAVDPRVWRQGVGNALVKALIHHLQEMKVEDIWLEVRVSNSVARVFYSKMGFKAVDRKIRYYWDEDAVIMKLNLLKGDSLGRKSSDVGCGADLP